jgi:L-2-hydroxyglutarate oxidase
LVVESYDFVIVGGGIVGCSIGRQIKLSHPEKSVAVLEKEGRVGAHASGRNSGVVHSGINQKPGSLKAKLVVRGSRLLREFCREWKVPMREVGTVVVARNSQESETLRELQRRAQANGVPNVQLLSKDELRKVEPYAEGDEALLSPSGAIVDNAKLVQGVADDAVRSGVSLILNAKVKGIVDKSDGLTIETANSTYQAGFLVNCAGLYADRVAQMMNVGRDYTLVPLRGDYYRIRPERAYLVNSMIYPPPNLEMPFLGVHLTRRTDDAVIIGPNAMLALGREKYRDASINWLEALRMVTDIRFARLISNLNFLPIALHQLKLSLSKEAFLKEAQALVPTLVEDDLIQDQSGIRAQLVNRKGRMVDDFLFERTEKSFHVLNAVSPGMTCAFAFAEYVTSAIFGEITPETA